MSTGAEQSISLLPRSCRIVVVNWNSGNRLRQCLLSIPQGFEVIVVDNASQDLDQSGITLDGVSQRVDTPGIPAREAAPKHLQGFECSPLLVGNTRNEGFAAAANLGAANCNRDFLLFLNPDVVFASQASADPMLRLLRERQDAAAATGRLVAPPGNIFSQPTMELIRPFPTLASALADILFFDELGTKTRHDQPGIQQIDQAPGACLLIRRKVFEELGGFDASFYPAWFEDVDLCRRLRDRRIKIFYHPEAVFYHEGGYS
ncbi:MAG TPA: glycosyltransferase, partial [Acidobacteriota bacterium]